MDREVCVICQKPLLGDVYALVACYHVSHRICLVRWLKTKPECPVCRTEVCQGVYNNLGILVTKPSCEPQPTNFVDPIPFTQLWSGVHSRLMDDSDVMELYTSDGEDLQPSYYRYSTLEFLKNLALSEQQYNEILLFKMRCGKRALCDAVNRMKVFLGLNERFQFTSVQDMLHKCQEEPCSVEALEEVYAKYTRMDNNVPVRENALRRRGCVYDFFELPEPQTYNRVAIEFNNFFRTTIHKLYGVYVRPMRPDAELKRFYDEFPHNLHNVLNYARLREKENILRQEKVKLKRRSLGCKRRHE